MWRSKTEMAGAHGIAVVTATCKGRNGGGAQRLAVKPTLQW
jgi:hypothetical protein